MSPNGRRAWRAWVRRQDLCRKHKQPKGSACRMARQARRHIPLVPGVVLPKPLTARSLVGMTMGARKRAWREYDRQQIEEATNDDDAGKLAAARRSAEHLLRLRIGARLRPCPGCANCDPCMASYGSFYGGDPRNFTPDEECSTEAERERHRQHCEAWGKGERPTVKVSGIDWTEALNYTGRDGQLKTCPAGYKFVERAAYGLGVTRATNDQEGRFCDGSGVLPARKSK